MTPSDKIVAGDSRGRFARLALRANYEFDLAEAALLIAAEDDPRCDVARCLALLDEWGGEAQTRLGDKRGAARIAAFNSFIFEELGFAGNQQNYYDPRNSLLNQVLERRTGIPITLSIVYCEVGRRAGLKAEGVGFPGHFMVRVGEELDGGVLVDPFNRDVLDEEDCQERLDNMYGGQVPLTAEHLRPATSREIIIRLLRNLKGIYAGAHLHRRALAVVERILLLSPQAFDERRDRGALLAQLGRYAEAVADLKTYLAFSPNAPDTDAVREQLKRAHNLAAMLN
ncbi:MAG TPA: transglutaminase-like domain-containing protein [Pyrinomonadaceae bacterium]|jgi:regulator of sirC expression with transglutaminase-like and TPR domain|nr:transglutaminase-like domain-containing protein [Pyrinomonadaceae bacterium]